MVPPVSHPSAQQLKELRAITVEAALLALSDGMASSSFQGYEIHAYCWGGTQGLHLRLVVTDDHQRPLLLQDLHASGQERDRQPEHTRPSGAACVSRTGPAA